MARTFTIAPAVRKGDTVKMGIMAPSGGGKTYSALRLSTGIQRVVGGDVGVADTENCRALKYADYFKFKHLDFQPPFKSMDYVEAFHQLAKDGCRTIIADSMSHEHAGIGGYLEFAEAELFRMAGDNYGKRQACKLASYIEPSKERRRMIEEIIRMKVNFIFLFRAKEKVKPIRDKAGKLEIENIGFMPIAGSELVFEMDCCCLLLPHAGGVPTWQSDEMGERMMIKQALQFEKIFEKAQPLSEEIGQQLATWAQGKKTTTPPPTTEPAPATSDPFPETTPDPLLAAGAAAAKKGTPALRAWFISLAEADQTRLRPTLDATWKPAAVAVTG